MLDEKGKPTRILACGSRTWEDENIIRMALRTYTNRRTPTTVMHGAAIGADTVIDKVAKELGLAVERYPVQKADYERVGRRAPWIRNDQMLDQNPDLLLAFVRGESPGTRGMCAKARDRGIHVVAYRHP